jgi:RNA polymerase sigma factor (sigma-70 family)
MHLTDESDGELLARSSRDPGAFGGFYRRHAEAVLRYLAYRTGSADQAADLTAEVFAAALEASARYRRNGGPARAWLFGIANHKLADSVRKGRIEDRARRKLGLPRIGFEDAELARVEELVDLELRGRPLEALVGDLPPAEREAVLARVVGERTYVELANELEITQAAARKRVSRGLARLASWTRKERR